MTERKRKPWDYHDADHEKDKTGLNRLLWAAVRHKLEVGKECVIEVEVGVS